MKTTGENKYDSYVMRSRLLEKYYRNNCSEEEVEILLWWLLKEFDDPGTKLVLQDFWDNPPPDNKADHTSAQQRLDKIHHKINLAFPGFHYEWKSGKKVRPLNWRQIAFRVAVILLLPVLTLFIYINYFQYSGTMLALNRKPVMNEIVSPVGSRISLELSDGTKVWLNHGSKLEYPQKFTGTSRTVKLVGEGYFEVAHNLHQPFTVETDDISVVALGTKFNVKAYPDDKTCSTTLESGKIEVKTSKGKLEMKPNQHLEFGYDTKKIDLQNVNPEKYIAWKDGKLVFKDDNFQNIAARLSRWYNVDIEILDPEVKELTYTATFIDEPLYQILEMLSVVTPISYQISKRHKLPDGTYSKRIIQVYLKE